MTKSVRRKQEIDDAYIDKLYSDVTSLYHLDQISSEQSFGKKELGPLPAESRILLGSLAVVWGLILLYLLLERLKKKKGYCSLRSQSRASRCTEIMHSHDFAPQYSGFL